MNSEQWAMVAVGLFRAACLAAIVLISYWGYRLFTLGLNAQGEVAIVIHNFKIKISKSAPGIFFIIAGGVGLCLEIYFGFAIVEPTGWRVSQKSYEKVGEMLASFDAKLQSIEELNKQIAALNTAFQSVAPKLAGLDNKFDELNKSKVRLWDFAEPRVLRVNDIDYVPIEAEGLSLGSWPKYKVIRWGTASPTPSPEATRPEPTTSPAKH
jgi:hypothetical protein